MENFVFQSPTRIIFGKGSEEEVGKETKKYTNKVLLHYGGQSIKKFGLYDKVIKSLKDENIEIFELGGVKPNPRLDLVYEGIKICRENKINFVLAVGGGSVIDSAKAIAIGVKYDGDVWDFFEGKALSGDAEVIPVGVVLTIPAAGSEASISVVITKEEGLLKRAYDDENVRPVFAILNPELTFTLPKEQTLNGIADIFAHGLERYFTNAKDVDFSDRLLEGSFRSLIKNSYLVLENPLDYGPRSEIMWNGLLIQNGIFGMGRIDDWASHMIEHELSAIYDIAHGAGLSIVFPAWMEYVYKHDVNRFAQFAVRVFGIEVYFDDIEKTAVEGIKRLKGFFKEIGLPTTLKDVNIPDDKKQLELMADKATRRGPIGNFVKLEKNDVLNILKLAAK
ncbi:MAG: iron-containing alcohol dehydrogenase [Actinobacteria bacterium]|nr:iron-containing alcohol dehydrogenase [Cyanobacteriota bacterium]MCL5771929.1 iron-containing alcohol dehydrogenase [Actinomycetota bacterium]